MRQAGTWDLEPFAAVLAPGQMSPSNKIQRNYKGLKITACMYSWGKLWTKRPKIQLPFLKIWEQKQGTVHAPCTQHHLRGGQTTSATPLPQPLDTPLPSPPIRNQLAPSRWVSKQGNLLLVFDLHCCSRGPNKALPEFLVWPLINFYWLRRPKSLVSNTNAGWMISVCFCESQRYKEIWAKTWRQVKKMTAYLFSIMLEKYFPKCGLGNPWECQNPCRVSVSSKLFSWYHEDVICIFCWVDICTWDKTNSG